MPANWGGAGGLAPSARLTWIAFRVAAATITFRSLRSLHSVATWQPAD